MGLKATYIDFIERNIKKVYPDFKNLMMLELGDQVIKAKEPYSENTGKEYFTNQGFNHTSVDLNGLNGAVVRDLRDANQFIDWQNQFNVLTNSGTTEHVEPFETQYDCFQILHNCLKTNGVFVHLLPDIKERDEKGIWWRHCHFYYSNKFFEMLATECNYIMLENTVIEGLRCAALQKIENSSFMTDRNKFLSCIEQRNWTKEHFIPKV